MGKQEEHQETVSESSSDEEDDEPEKWRKHYSSEQRMVLVGEGDFSFSLSLAKSFGSACNLGAGNARELEEKGGLVLYGVDAIEMSQHYFLRTRRLNKILLKGYLSSAKVMLKKEKAEIHVTKEFSHESREDRLGFA
ncbi:hypothetical protein DKX38_023335 [Salix brachista]|uniref:25S rRNA (uridine-N(3))-methyltransferase BMT5-like domain-containing protein n=1 Tax=Salix brachista TaxID=2182728 RepID=A0A5N5JKK0_9ROSI|nr:hypothetical protein DKX38_023335 [Salix brachista]